jgi:hypothetical protein
MGPRAPRLASPGVEKGRPATGAVAGRWRRGWAVAGRSPFGRWGEIFECARVAERRWARCLTSTGSARARADDPDDLSDDDPEWHGSVVKCAGIACTRPPDLGVQRLRAVVAQHEIRAFRDMPGVAEERAVSKAARDRHVGLVQLHELRTTGTLDPEETVVVLTHDIAGQANDALYKRLSCAAYDVGFSGPMEDDDVAATYRRSRLLDDDVIVSYSSAADVACAEVTCASPAPNRGLHRRDELRVGDRPTRGRRRPDRH